MFGHVHRGKKGLLWAVSSGSTLFAQVSGLVCRAERIKKTLASSLPATQNEDIPMWSSKS